VHVLQGERQMVKDNRTLGKFQLGGIPLAPRGVPQIEVTFDIDANGIVNVSAKDRGTGKTQAITITSSSGLAKDEVDRMVRDAQAHESEDKENRDAIELKNRADGLIYNAEKFLNENKDKLAETDVAPVNEALEQAKRAVAEGDHGAIEAAVQGLEKAQHKLAEVLYQKSAPAAPEEPPPSGETKPPGDDVVDAEVVDKN
jgi:molecular chaperone DnaK